MPTMLKVESVAVAPRMAHKDRYPLSKLKVGQSFFLAHEEMNYPVQANAVHRVRAAIVYWQRCHPECHSKFRVVEEPTGIRVGRIA